MRRAPRGFRVYKDKKGNYIFLDDVTEDDDPESIDNNKLPDELKNIKELGFIWHDEICEYILCIPRGKNENNKTNS